MKINEIKVARKFNLGYYELVDIGVSVSPDPEDEAQGMQELIKKLNEEIAKTKEVLRENGRL